jgi:hypothetical protein
VQGIRFGVQAFVQGLGFKVLGLSFRIQGYGGFKV